MAFAGFNAPRSAPVDPAIFTQPGTHIIGVDGQSPPGNWSSLDYYEPTRGVYELNINDGLIYKMDGWAVANCDGAAGRISVLPYWGDMLVATGKCQRVLWVPLNIGDSGALRWSPVGDLFPRIVRAIELLASLGLAPTYWLKILGQRDAEDGMSAAAFRDLVAWSINATRALGVGPGCCFIVGQGAYKIYLPPSQIAAIVQGQYDAAVAANASVGPNDDAIPDEPGKRVDGVHWASIGRWYTVNHWLPCFGVAA